MMRCFRWNLHLTVIILGVFLLGFPTLCATKISLSSTSISTFSLRNVITVSLHFSLSVSPSRLVSRYQMIQTRCVGIAWFIASSLSSVAGGCLSNKCGKCPLTMLIYCGLVASDLHGPTSPSFRHF